VEAAVSASVGVPAVVSGAVPAGAGNEPSGRAAAVRAGGRGEGAGDGATAGPEPGRAMRSGCQRAPSSKDTNTPVSVPAYRSPRRAGSSRTARTNDVSGRPPVMRRQVLP
jgi:hypothetical protein